MNKTKLTAACHKISAETGLSFNSVMIYYFLESILKKLSSSKYGKNFIFKGGFLLSNVVGIGSRTTVDMDFLLKNMPLSEENILNMLKEALKTESGDVIFYEIQGTQAIKEGDKYGGLRISIVCKLENIRQTIPLDIATGDVITPHPIDYNYISTFTKEEIQIKAYPIETMLAEKIQTIYSKGFLNSRSKDYYDLYIIYKLKDKDIDSEILKRACERTFLYRNTEFDRNRIIELMESLKTSTSFLKQWKAYSKKNIFACNLDFEEVLDNNIKIIKKMEDIKK